MSSLQGESAPKPESEPTATMEEARAEVAATIESIILTALRKAKELTLGSVDEIQLLVSNELEPDEEQIERFSNRAKRFLSAIRYLRKQKSLLVEGLREDASATELGLIVEQLSSWNQVWKEYVDELVNDVDSLSAVLENSGSGLQGRKAMTVNEKSMIGDDAKKSLSELDRQFDVR